MAAGKAGGSGLDNLSKAGKAVVGVMFTLLVVVAYAVLFYSDVDSTIEAQRNSLTQKGQQLVKAKEDNDRTAKPMIKTAVVTHKAMPTVSKL